MGHSVRLLQVKDKEEIGLLKIRHNNLELVRCTLVRAVRSCCICNAHALTPVALLGARATGRVPSLHGAPASARLPLDVLDHSPTAATDGCASHAVRSSCLQP